MDMSKSTSKSITSNTSHNTNSLVDSGKGSEVKDIENKNNAIDTSTEDTVTLSEESQKLSRLSGNGSGNEPPNSQG